MTKEGLKIDTLYINGQKPIKAIQDVNIGVKVSKIDEIILKQNRNTSLADVLADNSTVYIKSLGQGAMSTSSFRGASATHTQVLWNGIKINPTMSSSFDFSQIPIFFIDNVSMYHGNSYLKAGTGALGGSISIENVADYNNLSLGRVFLEYGSWNTYTLAAGINLFNKCFISKTKIYYQSSDNDFKYLNKILSKDSFYERRKESDYKQLGFMQEFYYKLTAKSNLSANIWYQYGDRRLPQPIVVNVSQHEKQKENNIKALLTYNYTHNKHNINLKFAYLWTLLKWRQWYDSNFSDKSTTNYSQSLQFIGDYTYTHYSKLRFNTQLSYNRDWVNATAYSVKEAKRDVFSLQANALYNISNKVSFQGQIMEELNNNNTASTFSFAGIYRIIPDKLKLKGNMAYNYKFPSMNDLYWQPGGDENLKPERGFSYDITCSLRDRFLNDKLILDCTTSIYLMNIKDWIMWLPNSDSWYWTPKNIVNVLSWGVEANASLEYLINNFRIKATVNYTYSPSFNNKPRFAEDASYKSQLPYIPLHKANLRLQFNYKDLFISYGINYIGKRFTTVDESYSTNAYNIHNLSIWHTFHVSKHLEIMPKLSLNNLFDAYYESTQYYPMPMRTINGGISFVF